MKFYKFYKSANTIPAFNFFEGIKTGNILWFIKGYNEDEEEDYSLNENQLKALNKYKEDIYWDYIDLVNDQKVKNTYKKQILIEQWEGIHSIVDGSISLYETTKNPLNLRYINQIEDIGWKIDFSKNVPKQVSALKRKLKGLRNRIKLFKSKITAQIKTDNKKREQGEEADIDKTALIIEQNLELKRELDTRTTTLKKFVFLMEMNDSKIRQYESDKRNNKRGRRKSNQVS